MNYKAVVIGSSAGGLEALRIILSGLPYNFPMTVIIVQHIKPDSESYLTQYLSRNCSLKVVEVDEKVTATPGCVYIAPPNYHVLIENDGSFTLSVEPRVCYARPSIDVLFETAANAFRENLIGIILTGANHDGSMGLKKIKENGGITIVQNPSTAEMPTMPQAAIKASKPDYIFHLNEISHFLVNLTM